jgi:hypothetical protein
LVTEHELPFSRCLSDPSLFYRRTQGARTPPFCQDVAGFSFVVTVSARKMPLRLMMRKRPDSPLPNDGPGLTCVSPRSTSLVKAESGFSCLRREASEIEHAVADFARAPNGCGGLVVSPARIAKCFFERRGSKLTRQQGRVTITAFGRRGRGRDVSLRIPSHQSPATVTPAAGFCLSDARASFSVASVPD